jgi:hypothetical protein
MNYSERPKPRPAGQVKANSHIIAIDGDNTLMESDDASVHPAKRIKVSHRPNYARCLINDHLL